MRCGAAVAATAEACWSCGRPPALTREEAAALADRVLDVARNLRPEPSPLVPRAALGLGVFTITGAVALLAALLSAR